jgi:hypothetical protein
MDNQERAELSDKIYELQARAEKAEYELRRWKEVDANRPDWEKLWEEQSERAEKADAVIVALESERDTLRDLLVTCRIRCERAEKALGAAQRHLAKQES